VPVWADHSRRDRSRHGTASRALRVIGKEPAKLRRFYSDLFGWEFDTSGPVSAEVSEAGNYGFVTPDASSQVAGIPGGIGGGERFAAQTLFYVGVPDIEEALAKAESLGGVRRMGPDRAPGTSLVVAHFSDPEGHLIGLASVS